METKATVVLGASPNEERYSNRAVRSLVAHGHPVIAVGLRPGRIGDVPIMTDVPADASVSTVTLYMNAENQRAWIDRIIGLQPQRIIFNPGAENAELEERARTVGIGTMHACTLVMLATGQY